MKNDSERATDPFGFGTGVRLWKSTSKETMAPIIICPYGSEEVAIMVSSFEQWYGQTVVLRLITGETSVPLRGIIVAESGDAVRFRVEGGWDIDVYKALILDVEREKERLNIH